MIVATDFFLVAYAGEALYDGGYHVSFVMNTLCYDLVLNVYRQFESDWLLLLDKAMPISVSRSL